MNFDFPAEAVGRARALTGCVVILLFGCQTAADHPDNTISYSMPGMFSVVPSVPQAPRDANETRWWASFGDPILVSLIDDCLRANFDLRVADARLAESRALWIESSAARRPSVRAASEYSRYREGRDRDSSGPLTDWLFTSGFDSSWELDVFGRVRALESAAHASLEAQAAARGDVAVILEGEVARSYFELRGQQESLDARRKALAVGEAEIASTRRRVDLGASSSLELDALTREWVNQEASLPDAEATVAVLINRICVLCGRAPGELESRLAPHAGFFTEPTAPAMDAPVSLLRRRADIRQSEQELVATKAIEKSVAAELFPRLTFNAQISFLAYGWNIGPNISWDVFDRRRVHARQRQASARVDAAFAKYHASILAALEDVENSVARLKASKARRDTLYRARDERASITKRMRRRVELGVSDKSELSLSERSEAEIAGELGMQEGAVRQAWVALYKAVGGGWTPMDPSPPS